MLQAIHTVLEVVYFRWGVPAHLNFLFFCLMTCLIVTAMLILGGAATLNALTGLFFFLLSSLLAALAPLPTVLPIGLR
jgi:Na+/proline symporter